MKSLGTLMAADDLETDGESLLLLDLSCDIPNGTVMNSGLENTSSIVDMKNLKKICIKVAEVKDDKFMGIDIELPERSSSRIVAVIDGDKAIALGDGKGMRHDCFG